MKRLIYILPLFAFAGLAAVLAVMLMRAPPAEMIDKPMPAFDKMMPEEPVLVNFFASWCTPCKVEHPVLMKLANDHNVTIYGLAHKDKIEDIEKYLRESGDPYDFIISDMDGRAFIDWGLAGVPESFIVHQGRIRYHHRGVISETDMTARILPVIKKLSSLRANDDES